MGGAGIQCGGAGIAFARASSARSRVFNAEVRFVWVQGGYTGLLQKRTARP